MSRSSFSKEITVDIEDDIILEYVQRNMSPEDVFSSKELRDWAWNNDYIPKDECPECPECHDNELKDKIDELESTLAEQDDEIRSLEEIIDILED